MCDSDNDDDFFREDEQQTSRKPLSLIQTNLPNIVEESFQQSYIGNDLEGLSAESCSFKTGADAVRLFEEQRGKQKSFLRIDPDFTCNQTYHGMEHTWEKVAQASPISTRLESVNQIANSPSSESKHSFGCSVVDDKENHDTGYELARTPPRASKLETLSSPKQSRTPPRASKLENLASPNQSITPPRASKLETLSSSKQSRTPPRASRLETFSSSKQSRTPPRASRLETLASPKQFVNSPTFLLDCTKCEGFNDKVLEADRPMLYFGLRPINSESEDAISFINQTDSPLTIKYCIPAVANVVFKLTHTSKEYVVRPRSKHVVNVVFTPISVDRFKSKIIVTCKTDDNRTSKYVVTLLGFGGTAMVSPYALCGKKNVLSMSAKGRYHFFPQKLNSFSFGVRNTGERDAFVYVILQDPRGEEINSVNPGSFLLSKHNGEQAVEVRVHLKGAGFPIQSGNGMGFPTHTAGGSQRSLASVFSSRPSSAMDNSSNSQVVFRIIVFWGEERQRLRLKCWEKNKQNGKLKILNRQLSWEIKDESAGDEMFLSQEDVRLCKAYLRCNVIEVRERRSGFSSRNSTARTVTGDTLIEPEPDNTWKACESMCNSTLIN